MRLTMTSYYPWGTVPDIEDSVCRDLLNKGGKELDCLPRE